MKTAKQIKENYAKHYAKRDSAIIKQALEEFEATSELMFDDVLLEKTTNQKLAYECLDYPEVKKWLEENGFEAVKHPSGKILLRCK